MKRLKAWWKKITQNAKFRCGAFAICITIGVTILILLLGAAADAIENRYALTLDCSFNAVTTYGDVTKAVLEHLDKSVTIYAIAPEDGKNDTLMDLLNRYNASERVTVEEVSALKNPTLIAKYSDYLENHSVYNDCLIIVCEKTGQVRVLDEDDYYQYSYDVETGTFSYAAYSYEKSITEAILYVSMDERPVVQILYGNGEITRSDIIEMENLLVSANYEVKWVSLLAGDTLNPENPLMILSPTYDFSDWELAKLVSFGKAGGDFFVISRYSDPLESSNMNALLRSYGVELLPGLVIAKVEAAGTYYSDIPVSLLPEIQNTDMTENLVAAGQTTIMLTGSRAFGIVDDLDINVTVTPILKTGDAYIRQFQDGSEYADQQPSDPEGIFDVALWSDRMYEDGTISHLFIMGNVSAFTDIWVRGFTASTPFLLQMIRSLQGKTPVNLDILPRDALREGLTVGSITPAIIVIIMLPLIILIGALMVLLPRKNL